LRSEWTLEFSLSSYPKTLFEMPMTLSTNSGSLQTNSHVSATFSISINSGEFLNLGISKKLWDIECWRSLINLRGKNNVLNCDPSQRDFSKCRPIVGNS